MHHDRKKKPIDQENCVFFVKNTNRYALFPNKSVFSEQLIYYDLRPYTKLTLSCGYPHMASKHNQPKQANDKQSK